MDKRTTSNIGKADDGLRSAVSCLDNSNMGVKGRIRRRLQRGTHFRVQANGDEFVYCLIPKNGCSSFKRFICETSEYKAFVPEHRSRFKFMEKYHRIRAPAQVARYDRIVFVYRDPVERICSLFRNKFVMGRGRSDIFDNYEKMMGEDADQATFDKFVNEYLTRGLGKLDRHCRQQSDFLFPVTYTHAIPVRDLHTVMTGVIGAEMADAYFKTKANSSEGVEYEDPSHDVPAHMASRRWEQKGEMPSYESLLTERTRATLKRVYADDFAMISQLRPR